MNKNSKKNSERKVDQIKQKYYDKLQIKKFNSESDLIKKSKPIDIKTRRPGDYHFDQAFGNNKPIQTTQDDFDLCYSISYHQKIELINKLLSN